MKKIISFLVAVLLGVLFSVVANAAEISSQKSTISVDGKETNFIRNEYYAIYSDYLFERAYNEYNETKSRFVNDKNFWTESEVRALFNSDKIGKMTVSLYDSMKNSEDEYYLSVYLNYAEDFSKSRNQEILKELTAYIDEVLYVGNTTPCAVVKSVGSKAIGLIDCDSVEFVTYSFDAFYNGGTPNASMISQKEFAPTAADARNILRYAAGLFDVNSAFSGQSEIKEFFYFSDTNLDGKITAADARIALRIAAGLEKGHELKKNTVSFWEY